MIFGGFLGGFPEGVVELALLSLQHDIKISKLTINIKEKALPAMLKKLSCNILILALRSPLSGEPLNPTNFGTK